MDKTHDLPFDPSPFTSDHYPPTIPMNRTALYSAHVAAGAKLVDFTGWEMPIQYSGVVDEYQAVRNRAGLFDVSHMGRVLISGREALPFIQHVTTNDASDLALWQSQYSMICNEQGGIRDDIFVYRVKPGEFLLCVNASNREKIVGWLVDQADGRTGVDINDRSAEVVQLAIQGPASRSILTEFNLPQLSELKPRQCLEATLAGATTLITRTGYTGELGYELYLPTGEVLRIWDELLTAGKIHGLKPAGLGARDLLRLEMGYLLYGNDIAEDTTPLEASASWVVAFNKGEFIGREILAQQRQAGPARRLVAFELIEKGVPRHGFHVVDCNSPNTVLGEVTSGNFSPILQKGIGLAYVPLDYSREGSSFAIDIRGKSVPAIVVKPPFYKKKG